MAVVKTVATHKKLERKHEVLRKQVSCHYWYPWWWWWTSTRAIKDISQAKLEATSLFTVSTDKPSHVSSVPDTSNHWLYPLSYWNQRVLFNLCMWVTKWYKGHYNNSVFHTQMHLTLWYVWCRWWIWAGLGCFRVIWGGGEVPWS